MTTPKLEDNIFGIRLRRLREMHDLSMAGLVDRLNGKYGASISKSAVSMWESGQREPMSSTIRILADFFCVSPAYLMGMEDDENAKPEKGKVESDDYIDSLVEAFGKLSIPSRIKLLSFAWDLLDKEGKA